jgi:hypothetical protein
MAHNGRTFHDPNRKTSQHDAPSMDAKELDLIEIPDERLSTTSSSQKSSCSKGLMTLHSSEILQGVTYQTFVSGDELPCGFKLRTYEFCQDCTCDCGGRVHNIELRIANDNLPRWERAGRLIRCILSAPHPVPTKQEANPIRSGNVVSGYRKLVQFTGIKDAELHEFGPTFGASRKPSTAVIQTHEGITDSTKQLAEEEQLIEAEGTSSPQPTPLSCHPKSLASKVREPTFSDAVRHEASKKHCSSRAKNLEAGSDRKFSKALDPDAPSEDVVSQALFALIAALTSVYGGIHMTAWNYNFPSTVERWLWRSSACTLLIPVAWAWVSCRVVLRMMRRYDRSYGSSGIGSRLGWSSAILYVTLVFVVVAFARLFILFESFISLRSVPIGVYAAVPWANFIPHI